ncbi:calsyntenin-2 [Tachysurus ichikawai]
MHNYTQRQADKICDKEWHYYVINVEFPVVTLYVDGVTYDPYLVTDDWPIHSSQIDVQLTVGACWQGGEVSKARFTQYFRGSLSGLTVRPGKIESQKVISCLQACKEGLDITSLESMDKGLKFHFNPAQSVLVIEGEDLEQVNAALRKVSYINSRQFPTAGARRIHISTTVQYGRYAITQLISYLQLCRYPGPIISSRLPPSFTASLCFGEDVCISVPDLDTVVMVMQPSEPRITITGAEHLSIPASDLVLGLSLFRDLHISSTVMKSDQTSHNAVHRSGMLEEIVHNLDYCDILVLGEELREGLETLQLPHSALLGKHLDYTNSTSGMSIYGVDSMVHYAQVIRQVRYQNLQNDAAARTFRVTCSELNGRYTSNPFTQQIYILHREQPVKHVSHIMAQPKSMQLSHHPTPVFNTQSSDVSGVVIVVCVAVLMVVVVSVMYQIYLKYVQEVPDENNQMKKGKDLDLSALTITVNPLESFEELQPAEELTEEEVEDEEDDDDDITSSESDSDEEEAHSMQPQPEMLSKLHWPKASLHC